MVSNINVINHNCDNQNGPCHILPPIHNNNCVISGLTFLFNSQSVCMNDHTQCFFHYYIFSSLGQLTHPPLFMEDSFVSSMNQYNL